jgi:hypothetical protein
MKRVLPFVLIALVASMIVDLPSSFANSTLDSLVNIATNARSQVKFQLESSQTASDSLKTLFEQGSKETELLISSVKQDDVSQAKQHFLAAMQIFKQVSVELSGQPQERALPKIAQAPQVSQATLTSYNNEIDRAEKYVGMLKDLVAKNNFIVDFSKADTLIQNARSRLAEKDIPSVEKIFDDLRAALVDIQNAIRDQTIQSQNERARLFANGYIAKIDVILAQANLIGLSDYEIARLVKAKQEIATTTDPNLLILKIKQYSITIIFDNSTNQRILAETSKLDARLANIGPYVDDNIKPKFDAAKQIVAQLKNQTSADEAVTLLGQLDSTTKEIENYVQTKQNQTTAKQTEADKQRPAKSQEQKSPTIPKQETPNQKDTKNKTTDTNANNNSVHKAIQETKNQSNEKEKHNSK